MTSNYSLLDNFCGSTFWNSSLSWNTDHPELTTCFEKTVLVWIPCFFLWLASLIEIYHICSSRERNIPWNKLSISKILIIIILMVLQFVNIIITSREEEVFRADYYDPILKLLTFTLAGTLLCYDRKYGVRTSGVLFIFWLLLILAGIPQLGSEIMHHNSVENGRYKLGSYIVYYCLILLMLILSGFADLPAQETPYTYEENQSPENRSGFLIRLTFSWFDPFILTGFRRSLDEKDMWPLQPQHASKVTVETFEKYWHRAVNKREMKTNAVGNHKVTGKNKEKKDQISILPILCYSFGGQLLFGSVLKAINDIITFAQPELLKRVIGFVEGDEPMWKGFLYATSMFVVAITKTAILGQHFLKARIVSVQIKNALTSAVFKKALYMSNAAKKESTIGEIVNLMSTDVGRFHNLSFFNLLWSAPLQISLALYFLWGILGPSVLAGVAVIIVVMPINGLIARVQERLQTKQMRYKDDRLKLMSELLNGIKVLKMYAWEPSFQSHILKIRTKELNILKKLAYMNSISSFIFFCTPFLVSLMSFTCFVLVNDTEVLDTKRAFVALALFNLLRFPMSMLPNVISDTIQISVSIKRLNKFLNADELDTNCIEHNLKEYDQIVIENGHFTWGGKDSDPVLKNINLRIPKGLLVAIVGTVGSGKSSLISALLGEMDKISGRINIKGNVAYVPQQAWIQNATVQDNILFGKTFDKAKYDDIINACALTTDLDILPGGDQTEIGEKGINLSGGQKQRVSLARAVYYDAENYYLDDPLSAVDSHVGKHIFDKVIGPSGLLKGKTRVWVTHNVSYLAQTDLVVVLRDGHVSEAGSYQQLLEKKGAFADFLVHHLSLAERTPSIEDLETIKHDLESNLGDEFHRKLQLARSLSTASEEDTVDAGDVGDKANKKKIESEAPANTKKKQFDQLIEAEKTETGQVKWAVYKHYFTNIGMLATFGTVLTYIVLHILQIGTNFWLAKWSSDDKMLVNGTVDTQRRDMYLGVYGGMGIAQATASFFGDLLPFLACWRAAKMMHAIMLDNVLKAPLQFFEVTPVGRILSRFSKDVDKVDASLPWLLTNVLDCAFEVVGILLVISYSLPWFMVVILPLGVLYYVIQRFYVATSRQLMRIQSAARSPIFSHFNESVLGATTIRAFNLTDRFVRESQNKTDHCHSLYYLSTIADRWLGLRLELVGNLVLFSAALFAVIGRGNVSPGLAGLSLSYTLEITKTLRWLVIQASGVETDIVSVERIKEYAEVKQEAAWNVIPAPAASWPETGALQLERLSLAYRPGGEPALRDVTCLVAPRDKLGIVGRTGAGKSTLTLGLFRIVEAVGGRILVDGLDVAAVGLHQLRSRITIIPQDPVLFSGTLRMNLDPFNCYSDEDLWRALDHAHLKPFVQGLAAGLLHEVSEGGENLSVGQRQLVCLARALLRKTPLLVLDEATAAVDLETDELIQKTIRTEFASCTVLTIAHRINTIMDSTKVMVLDKGQLVEFAPPEELLKDKNSIFYSLAKDAGLVN